MAYKNEIKEKAQLLRSQGVSVPKIAKNLGISKNTAYLWVKDVELSEKLKDLLKQGVIAGRLKGVNILKAKRAIEVQKISIEATTITKMFLKTVNKEFWQVCASLLFWCEGNKSLVDLRFTNSDPVLARFFLFALRKGFKLDEKRFKVLVHLHEYHNEQKQLLFWSKVTSIPCSQFMKSYLKMHTGKRKRKDYPGCASIRYADARLAKKLYLIYNTLANQIGA